MKHRRRRDTRGEKIGDVKLFDGGICDVSTCAQVVLDQEKAEILGMP